MYVRYRTLMVIAGLAMIAGAAGVWGWLRLTGSITQAQASHAVAAAEQAVSSAARVSPGADLLVQAHDLLELAKDSLARRNFVGAYSNAIAAERLAQQLIETRRAGNEADVRIVRLRGEVRFKRAGQFLWESASERDQLRPGDQLRTGAGGLAQLLYFDGTTMTVDAGTLLEIRELNRDQVRRTQHVSERLAWGQIQAQTRETQGYDSVHEVDTESASVRARRAAEFRVSHDKDLKSSEIVSTRGALTVKTAGAEQQLPPATRLRIEEGRVVERSAVLDPPRLVAPADQKILTAARETGVRLSWIAVERASGYRVQVSDRPPFLSAPIADQRSKGEILDLSPLGDGTYYWQVAALDSGGREGCWSESRKFRVLSTEFKDPDDKTPPALAVSEVMVVGAQAIVTGRAEPGALLWIDNERVDLEDDGRFTWVVKLRGDGENKVHLVAQDAAGNETRRTVAAYVDAF
jgi:hypothetical protein